MTNLKDVIIELREVYAEEGWSYNKILKAMEDNGDFVSKSTLSRLFGDGWEDYSFDYERTVRPVAKVLLGMEQDNAADDIDTKALKSILRYKIQRISELEQQIEQIKADFANQKLELLEKMDAERAAWGRSIEFLKEQVAYKDRRMDLLLGAVQEKDKLHKEMLEKVLLCSRCGEQK